MAPRLTPFPLIKMAAATPTVAVVIRTRWHNSKIITSIIIAILLFKTQHNAASDVEVSSTLRHHYNDSENFIYHDEDVDAIKSRSSSHSRNTTNTNNIETPEVFTCPAEGLYAHNYECQLYYRCETQTNGYIKAYLLNCKKGTIFSRDLKLCMPTMLANREECQQYINEIDTLASDDNVVVDAAASIGAGVNDKRQGVYYGGYGGDVINSSFDGDDDGIDSRLMHVLNEAKVKGGIAHNGNAMDSTYNHWKNYGLTGLSGVSVISFSTSSARSAGSSSAYNDQGPPCEDDGFMSDPDDCTIFYRCISNGHAFNKIGFRCSDGTAWDKSLQSCNHMLNVRANGGCEGKKGIQMDEYNTQQTSTQSSYQNSTASSANSQQNSTSSSSSSTSSSSSSSSSQQSSTHSNNTASSSSSSNSQSSSSSSQNNNSNNTNSDSNQNSNVQNPANSSNQENSNSNAQNISQQNSNSNANNSNSNSQNTSQNSNANESSTSQNSSNNSNQEHSNSQNSGNSQNSNSQQSSNSNSQQAINQESSSAHNSSNNQQNSNNSQESSSSSPHESNNSSNQQQVSSNSTTQCVDENTYLPDKENCAKFYRCRDNGNGGLEIVPFTCGPGTVWNHDDKVCDFPSDAQREKCKITSDGQEQGTSSSSNANSQSNSSENQSASSTSQSGTSTINNNQSVASNQSNNQAGSSSNGNQSSSSNNQSATSGSQSINNQSNNQSATSSNSGNQAISSSNQSDVSNGQSGSSSANNQSNNQSNQSSSTNNQSNVSSSQSSSNNQNGSSNNASNQTQSSTSSSNQQGSNTEVQQSKPSNPEGECENSETYLQDKYDCGRFYRCVNKDNGAFNIIAFDCAPGTIWDPESKGCNHPTDVQKERCKVIANNGSSGSSTNQSNQSSTATSETNQSSSSNQQESSSSSGSSNQNSSNTSSSSNNSQQSGSSNNQVSNSQSSSSSSGSQAGSQGSNESTQSSSSSNNQHPETSNQISNSSIASSNNNNHNQESNNESSSGTTSSSNSNQGSSSNQSSSGSQQESSTSNVQSESSSSTVSNNTSSTAAQNQGSSSASSSQSNSNETSAASSSSSTAGQSSNNQTSNNQSTATSSSSSSQEASSSQSTTQGSQSNSNSSTTGSSSTSSQSTSSAQQSGNLGTGSTTAQQNPVGSCNSNNQYLEDSKDCAKFYRCVKNNKGGYDKIAFTCGPGTVWDSQIDACNHAWAVKNKNCGTNSSSISTSENQPETQQSTTKPPSSSTTNKPLNSSTTLRPTSSKPVSTQRPTVGETTSVKPTPQPHGICKSEGFIRDPKDCSRFYRCVDNGSGGFIQYSFRCGQGTIWDSELQTCNHDLKKCNSNIDGETSWTQNPQQVTTSRPGYVPSSQKPQTTSSVKPEPQSTTQNLQETTTTKPVTKPTTHTPNEPTTQVSQQTSTKKPGYQPTTETSQQPTTTKATTVQIPQDLTTTKPGYQPTTESTTSGKYPESTAQSLITTTKPNPNKPLSYNDNCSKEGFFGDDQDCQKFYRCIDNGNGSFEKHSFKCGNNTVWDSEIESCNHPRDVMDPKCRFDSTTIEPGAKPSTTYKPTSTSTESIQSGDLTTTMQPTSTTPIPNLPPGTKCNGEGFMADPNNCRKFYRCIKTSTGYEMHEFKCAKNTAWNEENQTCDHRNNVGSCQGQTEEPDPQTTTISYESTTTQKYSSTTMTTSTEAFEKPTTMQSTTSTPSSIIPSTTMPSSNPSTTLQPTSTTTISNLPPGKNCDGEGYMADPDNCRKFYRCEKNGASYSKHEFMCAKGTGWSEEKQTCDHRDNIDRCQGQTDKPDYETTTTEYTTIKPTSNSSTTMDYEQPTTSTEYEKPTSSYETSTVSTQIPNLQPTQPTGSSTDYTTTTQPSTTTSIPNLPAGKKCNGEGFMADPDNCRKFYRCEKNNNGFTKHEFMCAKGTGWSEEKQTCDYKANIGGCQGQTDEPEPEATTMKYTTSRPTTTSANGSTTNEKPSTTTTATTNTSTQKPTTTTLRPTTAESSSSTESTSTTAIPILPPGKECTAEGFMADPDNCRKFYRCEKNGNDYSKHEFICGRGTGWSEEKQTCDHRDNIDRCQGQTEEPELETTTTEYTSSKPTYTAPIQTTTEPNEPSTSYQTNTSTTTSEAPTTTQATESSSSSTVVSLTTTEQTTTMQPTSTTPVPNLPPGKKCPGEGFMADPDNCRKFYRCTMNDGKLEQHEFMCGTGTGWSEDKQTCDHAAHVKRCEGQKEETENSTAGYETTTHKPTDTTTVKTTARPVASTTIMTNPTTTEQITDKPGYVPTTMTSATTTNPPATTDITTSYPTTMSPGYDSTTAETSLMSTTTEEQESTTTEPINYNCTSEGFFPDTTDCNRYYRCVDADKTGSYQVYSFRCPNGTVWDTSLETCNYADKVSENCSSATVTTEYPSTSEALTESTTTDKPATTTTESSKETSTVSTIASTTTDIPKESTTVGVTEPTTIYTTTTATPDTTTIKSETTTENPKDTTTTEPPELSTTEKPKDTTTTSPPLESTTSEQPPETTEESKDTTTSMKPETTTAEAITGEVTTQPENASNNTAPCPPTSEGQNLYVCPTGFRRHPKHCSMFYQCTEKADSYDQSIVVFTCPNGTVYHEDLNRCNEPKPSEDCKISARTQTMLFEEEYKRSHMIQIRTTEPLCPDEGHFALNKDECAQIFVKCQYSTQTLRLEGQIFRCPKGFTYWAVSRRCERTQKLQNCSTTKYNVSSSIPVEWSNIGNRRRNLKV